MLWHRPMLVALIGEPTEDDRMIESLALDPDRLYPVYDPDRPGRWYVRLRQVGDRIEAIVPRWWRRQLTLDLDPMGVQFWERPGSPDGMPPLWVFVGAPILGLCRSGGPLPAPWAEKARAA